MADADGKTLVFSFDGTGNEPSDADEFQEDESISNILKLHISPKIRRCPNNSE